MFKNTLIKVGWVGGKENFNKMTDIQHPQSITLLFFEHFEYTRVHCVVIMNTQTQI